MNTLQKIHSRIPGGIGNLQCTMPSKSIQRIPMLLGGLMISLWVLVITVDSESRESAGRNDAGIRFDLVFDMETKGNPAILQDNEGFMWFGSRDGLFRWDGHELKVYHPGPDTLSNGSVYGISQDPVNPDILWLSTRGGGLNRFDTSTERVTYYQHKPNDPASLFTNDLYPVVHDASDPDTLFICSASGFSIFSKTKGTQATFAHIPNDPQSMAETECFPVIQDLTDPQIIWMGTWGKGVEKFDRTTGTFTHFPNVPDDPDSFGAHDGIVFALTRDKDDPRILWLGTICCGLEKFDTRTGVFSHYPPAKGAPETIGAIYDDGNGRLWLGGWIADSGLTLFDKKRETFTAYKSDPKNNHSLPDDTIVTIYADRDGRIWFSSYSGKVGKYDPYNQNFTLYRHIPDDPGSLVDNSVNTIYEDRQGIIWIGTQGGLSRYDPVKDAFTSFRNDATVPQSLDKNNVLGLFEDAAGDFWISTYYGTLHKFDRHKGLVSKSYGRAEGNAADGYSAIIQDPIKPRYLWMAGRAVGLTRFDRLTETFTHYPPDADTPENGSSSKDISCLIHDRKRDVLWFGGWAGTGLNRLDKRTGKFSHFKSDPQNPQSLRNNAIGDIYQDSADRLWIGTVGAGLARFAPLEETFTHFAAAHSVPPDISGILEDEKGYLWLSTNEGLVRFNVATETVDRRYIAGDGLQGTKFSLGSRMKARNGELWFGGENGLSRFHPDRLIFNRHIPQLAITSLTQGGQAVNWGGGRVARKLEQIQLDWQQPFFEFGFSALNFTVPQKNQYRYILEGWDTEWYEAGTQHKGRYSGLSSGEYTLRITGSNNDGIWNDEGVTLKVIVTRPFWQTLGFRITMGMMLTGVTLLIIVWRFRAAHIRQARLEALVEERTKELADANTQLTLSKEQAEAANQAKNRFLANISHELRTPLNSILGFTNVLKQHRGEPQQEAESLEIIEQSGKHLLDLIDDILDIARIEAGKVELNPQPMDLDPFLDSIGSMVLGRAEAKGLSYVCRNNYKSPIRIVADSSRLRQVLLNLVGNAIKFTDQGSVNLTVEELDSKTVENDPENVRLRFTVTDTGMGIPIEAHSRIFHPFEQAEDRVAVIGGTGLGLAISQEIVTLMGSRIEMLSEPGKGSTFWFEVPLKVIKAASVQQPTFSRPPIGYEGQRRRILVADDVDYNRQVLVAMLEPLGFDVLTAVNGKQAVEMAKTHQPDAIVMDMVMPVKTGDEAIRELKRDKALKHVVVISVSADVQDTCQNLSLEVGSDAFLPKPLREKQLLTTLADLLHLQWRYEKTETPETTLPPETLAQLTELIRVGRIRRFRELLDQLEEKEDSPLPLIAHLQKLARHYEVKQIMSVLKRCATSGSSN